MAGGWSWLPADLLKEVSARLAYDADHLHVRQVCAHWRASTSRLSTYRPWILAGRREANGPQLAEYSLRLLPGARRVDMAAAPPPGLPYCRGAGRGWLVLSDDDLGSPTRLVLWEPLSGAEIALPRLCPVTQVFLSGDPLALPHWMAVASQPRGADTYVLFWRPGDAAWSELSKHGIHRDAGPVTLVLTSAIHSVEFYAGCMYCITEASNIVIYDLKLGTTSAPAFVQSSHVSLGVYGSPASDNLLHSVRVVDCGGQILIVLVFGFGSRRRPSRIEVYRPFRKPRELFQIGDRVTDLAGWSLFLGHGDVFALPAKGFPAIKGNRIYYMAHCLEDTVLGLVFDLKTDAVEEIPYPRPREEDGNIITWSPYSWFCPRKPFQD